MTNEISEFTSSVHEQLHDF